MPRLVGHRSTTELLDRARPRTLLIQGPPAVGRRVLARDYAELLEWDESLVLELIDPSMGELREAVEMLRRKPAKFLILELSRTSIRQQNYLLKTLEELPGDSVVVVIAEQRHVLTTVASRCLVVTLGMLNEEDLTSVLIASGLEPAQAKRVASMVGVGTVADAHFFMTSADEMAAVSQVVKAFSEGDRRLLEHSTSEWTPERHQIFVNWVAGQAASRGPVKTMGPWSLDPRAARRLLARLASVRTNTPRSVIRLLAAEMP